MGIGETLYVAQTELMLKKSNYGLNPANRPTYGYMISQHLLIQSFALDAAIWPEFRCQVMPTHAQFEPTFRGLEGARGENSANRNLAPYSYLTSVQQQQQQRPLGSVKPIGLGADLPFL